MADPSSRLKVVSGDTTPSRHPDTDGDSRWSCEFDIYVSGMDVEITEPEMHPAYTPSYSFHVPGEAVDRLTDLLVTRREARQTNDHMG